MTEAEKALLESIRERVGEVVGVARSQPQEMGPLQVELRNGDVWLLTEDLNPDDLVKPTATED